MKKALPEVTSRQGFTMSGRLDSNQRPPEPHSGAQWGLIGVRERKLGITSGMTRVIRDNSDGDAREGVLRRAAQEVVRPFQPGRIPLAVLQAVDAHSGLDGIVNHE